MKTEPIKTTIQLETEAMQSIREATEGSVIELTATLQEVPKESLLQSGRFQAAGITFVIDALLAMIPILVHNAEPAFVAQLREAVMLLQILLTSLSGVFILARTFRDK